MSITVALAGDTLVGATDASALDRRPPASFFSSDLVAAVHEADLCILNLECCISGRGERWPAAGKQFFFRAPPRAVEILSHLGVDCVNLANNHSLDFGRDALLDTFEHLTSAGIPWVGAGPDLARARASIVLQSGGFRLAVLGFADHPSDFAARPDRAGTAVAGLENGELPPWLLQELEVAAKRSDAVLLTPHWGPNFTPEPPAHVRKAAESLRQHATVIAGHSAHVIHGVGGNVLYDLGDFLEAYPGERASGSFAQRALRRGFQELRRVGTKLVASSHGGFSPRSQGAPPRPLGRLVREARAYRLRGDTSLLFLVTLDGTGPKRLEALPLKLTHSHTRLAHGAEAAQVKRRFRRACRALGTSAVEEGGRLVVTW